MVWCGVVWYGTIPYGMVAVLPYHHTSLVEREEDDNNYYCMYCLALIVNNYIYITLHFCTLHYYYCRGVKCVIASFGLLINF